MVALLTVSPRYLRMCQQLLPKTEVSSKLRNKRIKWLMIQSVNQSIKQSIRQSTNHFFYQVCSTVVPERVHCPSISWSFESYIFPTNKHTEIRTKNKTTQLLNSTTTSHIQCNTDIPASYLFIICISCVLLASCSCWAPLSHSVKISLVIFSSTERRNKRACFLRVFMPYTQKETKTNKK